MQAVWKHPTIWLGVGVLAQVGALIAVITLDPAGLDRCEAVPAAQTMMTQRRVGNAATLAVLCALAMAILSARKAPRTPSFWVQWCIAVGGLCCTALVALAFYNRGFFTTVDLSSC